ncbi:RCC1 domain-containing protein [Pseudobacteroides cellulosolvens]|nr:RCC1 domain-containing protein [Pseudobacteroides cellulosolvens]
MVRKLLSIFIALCILASGVPNMSGNQVKAHENSIQNQGAPELDFAKTVYAPVDGSLWAVKTFQTPQNTYIQVIQTTQLTGTSPNKSHVPGPNYIYEFGSKGEVKRSIKFENFYSKGLSATAATMTKDGGILIVGSYLGGNANQREIKLLKFDKDFKLLWEKDQMFEQDFGYGFNCIYFTDIVETGNGKFIATGLEWAMYKAKRTKVSAHRSSTTGILDHGTYQDEQVYAVNLAIKLVFDGDGTKLSEEWVDDITTRLAENEDVYQNITNLAVDTDGNVLAVVSTVERTLIRYEVDTSDIKVSPEINGIYDFETTFTVVKMDHDGQIIDWSYISPSNLGMVTGTQIIKEVNKDIEKPSRDFTRYDHRINAGDIKGISAIEGGKLLLYGSTCTDRKVDGISCYVDIEAFTTVLDSNLMPAKVMTYKNMLSRTRITSGPARSLGICIYSAIQTPDEGFMLSGQIKIAGEQDIVAEDYLWIARVNKSGTVLWENTVKNKNDRHYAIDLFKKSQIFRGDAGEYVIFNERLIEGNINIMSEIMVKTKAEQDMKISASAPYDMQKKLLYIQAEAECPYHGMLTPLNTDMAKYQLLDKNGNSLSNEKDLTYNNERKRWEAADIKIEAGEAVPYQVKVKFADKEDDTGVFFAQTCVFDLFASSPATLGEMDVYFFSPARDINGKAIGSINPLIDIRYGDKIIKMTDKKDDGDINDDDGTPGAFVRLKGDKNEKIELIACGKVIASVDVASRNNADLVVLTNFANMYEGFIDNGLMKDADEDSSFIFDFYDALLRISSYANSNNGVVVDNGREIKQRFGMKPHYKDGYNSRESIMSGTDAVLEFLSMINPYKNVAIIGDDYVIPFYRRSDPIKTVFPGLMDESTYDNDVTAAYGSTGDNITVEDTASNYIMSDIPYAIYGTEPVAVASNPAPDAGIGRIFSDSPLKLIKTIDFYSNPINADPKGISGSQLYLKKDSIDWPDCFERTFKPVWIGHFIQGNTNEPTLYEQGKYYAFSQDAAPWNAEKVSEALTKSGLTVLSSHASHFSENTGTAGGTINISDYKKLPDLPGHVLLNEGCHSGYTLSKTGDETGRIIYEDAFAKTLMEKGVTYVAPSTYGWRHTDVIALHEKLIQSVLGNVLRNDITNMGQATVESYKNYWASVPPEKIGVLSEYTTSAYGTVFYGLPTQQIIHDSAVKNLRFAKPDSVLSEEPVLAAPVPSAPQAETLKVDFQFPYFKVEKTADGSHILKIPNSSGMMGLTGMPVLPLAAKTISLPKGTVINSVKLTDSKTHVCPEKLNLQRNQLINGTKGIIYEYKDIPEVYPNKNYWWQSFDDASGLKLIINTVPASYSGMESDITIYDSMSFEVEYTLPNEPVVKIIATQINGSSPVLEGSGKVNTSLEVEALKGGTYDIRWYMSDQGGLCIKSGSSSIVLAPGKQTVFFSADTVSGSRGQRVLRIDIVDLGIGEVIASNTVDYTILGQDFTLKPVSKVFYTPENYFRFDIEAYDEKEEFISGLVLGKELTVKIDGKDVSGAVLTEDSEKTKYSLKIPGSAYLTGSHSIEVNYKGDAERTGVANANFEVMKADLFSNVKKTAGSTALRNDGTVWTWGNGRYGQLGNEKKGIIFSAVLLQR